MARELLYIERVPRQAAGTKDEIDAMNNAIDHYILHEISELRSQEQRINAALGAAPSHTSSDPFIRALARLQARVEELDWVLDQLDVIGATEPAAA